LKQEDLEERAEENVEWDTGENIINTIDKDYERRENKNEFLTLSSPFKLVICGASNVGKTMAVLNLIYKGHIYFDTLTIVSFTARQQPEKYGLIEDLSQLIPSKFKMFDKPSQVKLKKYDKTKVNVVILDDVQELSDKTEIESAIQLWTLGRHYSIQPVWLGQDYYKTPLRIRSNSSHYMFFKSENKKSINRMYMDVAGSLEKDEFYELYKNATEPRGLNDEYPYLIIDTTQKTKALRFRRNWRELYMDDDMKNIKLDDNINDNLKNK
jgi:hypothetical protein